MHDWQLVSPGAVEYWPVGHGLHRLPSRRYPALHCLRARRVSHSASPSQKKATHQGQLDVLGVSVPHETYALFSGLLVQSPHA